MGRPKDGRELEDDGSVDAIQNCSSEHDGEF